VLSSGNPKQCENGFQIYERELWKGRVRKANNLDFIPMGLPQEFEQRSKLGVQSEEMLTNMDLLRSSQPGSGK
jgi:hypothetical protein